MGFLDFLPVIGDVVSGIFNNDEAEDRQDNAQAFSAQQYASRYQTTVKDMVASGLNPGLAYGGISGSPPTSSAASSAGMPGLGSSFNEGRRVSSLQALNSAQVANIEADTANKDAQGDLLRAQAAAARSSAGQADANVKLIEQQAAKIIAEIPNIKETLPNISQQRDVIMSMARMLRDQAELYYKQGETQSYVQRQLFALLGKIDSETKLNQLDIDAALKFDNLGRDVGQLKPFFDILRMFLRRGSN